MSRLTQNVLEVMKAMARVPGFDRVLDKVLPWERLLGKARRGVSLARSRWTARERRWRAVTAAVLASRV